MTNNSFLPHLTVVLAITLDGKISTDTDVAARFSSSADLAHLEAQISLCDAVIFGANTLRAYGTSLVIKNPELLRQRELKSKPPQPLHIVCSPSGNLNPDWRFFSQPLPRALLTTEKGEKNWQKIITSISSLREKKYFLQYFITGKNIKWSKILKQLKQLKYEKIAILGGAKLMSSLLKENLINDIWLTICPLIIGKETAPDFLNSSLSELIELKLLEVKNIGQEIFIHYSIKK